jgi:hypothetical protein
MNWKYRYSSLNDINWKYRYASDKSIVIKQLSEDYPVNSLEWVKETTWEGPETVEIKDVDYANYKNWQAYHEPKKVKKFEKKISKGKRKPVILVKTPKNKKYIVIDGHHRALAYRHLNRPLMAWIGYTKSESGPWDTFHDEQKHSKNPDSTKSEN